MSESIRKMGRIAYCLNQLSRGPDLRAVLPKTPAIDLVPTLAATSQSAIDDVFQAFPRSLLVPSVNLQKLLLVSTLVPLLYCWPVPLNICKKLVMVGTLVPHLYCWLVPLHICNKLVMVSTLVPLVTGTNYSLQPSPRCRLSCNCKARFSETASVFLLGARGAAVLPALRDRS